MIEASEAFFRDLITGQPRCYVSPILVNFFVH